MRRRHDGRAIRRVFMKLNGLKDFFGKIGSAKPPPAVWVAFTNLQLLFFQSIVKALCTGRGRYGQATSADRWVQSNGYASRPRPPLCASHGRCGLSTADRCVQATADRCVQSKGNAAMPRPTSADRCAQATAERRRTVVCKRRAMRAGHARRRLTVVCKRRAMRAGHARRRLTVVCKRRAMRAGHARRRLTVVCKRRAMRAGHARRRLTVVCKRRAMRAGNARRRLSDACKRRAMQPGDVRRDLDQGRAVHGRCGEATADVG
ncbi:hypothetical protein KY290_013182 [Solanum tuberosum]|uniref:Uncharacterized protein n=1 Tax=Solanum tuberosum TaxID=4113 RepID=A0ABQ7VME0_SOLTU|nr:hypothetical protein KY285_012675 [Solanum tuberosum]KAH0769201.1 hypothetical protein KY290_013182 [Solanum tuberosum]